MRLAWVERVHGAVAERRQSAIARAQRVVQREQRRKRNNFAAPQLHSLLFGSPLLNFDIRERAHPTLRHTVYPSTYLGGEPTTTTADGVSDYRQPGGERGPAGVVPSTHPLLCSGRHG